MLWLKGKQKDVFAEKFLDLGNLAVATLIFGQFLSGRFVVNVVMVFGAVAWIVAALCATVLLRESR